MFWKSLRLMHLCAGVETKNYQAQLVGENPSVIEMGSGGCDDEPRPQKPPPNPTSRMCSIVGEWSE